jgi:peptidoglycan/LPS O-acetylase OafA/YrhL
MSQSTTRIHGLDTLRALAVMLVVLHHYVLFVSGEDTFGWVGEIGWVGVDLFFALSGYLIGNQIFQSLRAPGCALLAVALGRRSAGSPWLWAAFALAFAGGTAVRAGTWLHGQDVQNWLHFYYKYIYYSSLCRFDELLAGVALALLKNFHGAAWARLMGHGRLLLAAGCATSALARRWFLADHYGLWPTVFGYPLLALGCALLILAALAPDSPLHRVRVPGAGRVALWSYAIYLVHKQVCILAARPLAEAGYGPRHPLTIAVALALSVLAGWLLYRLVETPFMRLRTRYVPGNGVAPRLPAGAR